MKKLKLILGLALATLVAGQAAQAVPTNVWGDIAFTGGLASDTGNLETASSITIIGVEIQKFAPRTGAYSGVDVSSTVTFASPIAVANGAIGTLWSFTDPNSSNLFSLEDAIVTLVDQSNGLFMSGTGIAKISGGNYNDTAGTWSLSAQQGFSFSAGTSVPDSGTTVSLLGLSLIGLAAVARRFKR